MSRTRAPGTNAPAQLHEAAREAVDEAFTGLNVTVTGRDAVTPGETKRRGSSRRGATAGRVHELTLVDVGDGALVWRESVRDAALSERRRGATVAPGPSGDVVHKVDIEELAPNQVIGFLQRLDQKLTPNQGLRRITWKGGRAKLKFEPAAGFSKGPTRAPVGSAARRVLLIVHGTFSNGDQVMSQLADIERDAGFLTWAASQYDEVYSFDHPTLSVSPMLNALDLARLFEEVKVPVDVICHSRGGLVVRWWLEAFGGASVGPRRAVFVGSPLGGTSLASPPKLRAAVDFFTSVGSHLKTTTRLASLYFPFMSVATGLLTVFTSVTGVVANTPMVDAAAAMIPGLGGQSRVGNNEELNRLHAVDFGRLPEYFAVQSDFCPESPGWAFWKYFVNIGDRVKSGAASLVFNQPNDLVVDTRSMTQMLPGRSLHPQKRVCDFGTNDRIHHTNYFLQPQVVGFFKDKLN